MERSVKDWGGNIAAFVVVLIFNGMANGLPIGGRTTGEISAAYPSLFTPAGITFSIWGLIYAALLVFIVWQALPAQRGNSTLADISGLFQLNCIINGVWIVVWHYDFIAIALLLMFGLLYTLVRIFRRLDSTDSWLVRFPFSLYTAWITVATIANISVLQTALGWNDLGLNELQWTWLKLAVAGAIGATVIARTRNIVYILVIAWAAFGIFNRQSATPEVAGAAITLSLLALLLAAIALMPLRDR